MPSTSGATNFRASARTAPPGFAVVFRWAAAADLWTLISSRLRVAGGDFQRPPLVTRASGIDGHPSIQGRRRECATAYDSQSRCGPSADHPSPVSSGPYRFLAVTAQRAQIPVYGSVRPFALEMVSRGGGTRTPDLRFWRPPLYQLSYTPRFEAGIVLAARAPENRARGGPRGRVACSRAAARARAPGFADPDRGVRGGIAVASAQAGALADRPRRGRAGRLAREPRAQGAPPPLRDSSVSRRILPPWRTSPTTQALWLEFRRVQG